MLGISYGEMFLLLGATAALMGPKDLPKIARTAGRLAGRSIGYVQLARGQFDNIMQQTQARQVHKELQDTMAQLEAIRHEIRTISFVNPGPMTTRLVDNLSKSTTPIGTLYMSMGHWQSQICVQVIMNFKKTDTVEIKPTDRETKLPLKSFSSTPTTSGFNYMHSQAAAYAKLAETAIKPGSIENTELINELTDDSGITVLPVSAESAKLLPDRKDTAEGSDVVSEAILEAEVARNAKEFFVQQHSELKDQ